MKASGAALKRASGIARADLTDYLVLDECGAPIDVHLEVALSRPDVIKRVERSEKFMPVPDGTICVVVELTIETHNKFRALNYLARRLSFHDASEPSIDRPTLPEDESSEIHRFVASKAG